MAKTYEVGKGGLTKRHTTNGWRWCGQIRYKDEGGTWRTMLKALVDEDGNPIYTDPDDKTPDGKRVRTTRNIRKAEKALVAWKETLSATPMGGTTPVATYIRNDLKGRVSAIAPSTMRKYLDYVRLIEPGFEGVAMRDVDVPMVRKWVQGMAARGLKLSTIKSAYALLRLECRRAVDNGHLRENPCRRGIIKEDAPQESTRRKDTMPNALDADGVRRANALLDATTNGRLRIGARLALACGLRSQECCGLRWKDVDIDGREIHVENVIGRAVGGTYDKDPKSYNGDRRIVLNEPVARELAQWRDVQLAQWKVAFSKQDEEVKPFEECYVIGYADGRFITPHALSNAWSKLAEKGDGDGPLVGTRGRRCTFHGLRHSFATHVIAEGGDVKSVAEIMGHDDATVTLRLYGSATEEAKRRAMQRASSVLSAGSQWAVEGDAERG